MVSNQLQKRIYFLIVTIGAVSIILITLPFIEGWVFQNIYTQFDLRIIIRDSRETVVTSDGSQPGQLAKTLLNILVNLFRIIKIVLWLAIVVSLVRLITNIVFGAALKKPNQYEISSLVRTVLSIVIYIVAFFIIFQTQYPNVPLAPLFTGSTILGIVVGLALQDTLGNLFAGIAIQADQSFQVGDFITITNHGFGTVESMSWRGVKIRTFQNKLLLISNSVIGKETIEVAQKEQLNARVVRFNTLYTNSPAKVIQTVREIVRDVDNVSPKRRPKVRIWNLGGDGLDWEIKYWTSNYRRFNDTDALIRQRIWYAFQREGLEFAYPTRTIYTAAQGEQKEVFVETADEICERINNVPMFAPLSTEQTGEIARTCLVRVFAPEERIIQKGQTGQSMFIIHRGSVRVQVMKAGLPKTINTLNVGEFFGEMSLFTGEPRTADVVADTETKVIEIRAGVMKPILKKNPELAKIISEIIEERREVLEVYKEDSKADAAAETKGVFNSIRRFFGLR